MVDMFLTGGTGSFGRTFIDHVLESTDYRITSFSRDELKQMELREKLVARGMGDRVSFVLGDVRDPGALHDAIRGHSLVVHAAALKQIPALERAPLESIKTNVLGSVNVAKAAWREWQFQDSNRNPGDPEPPRGALLISTDKAVNPSNTYGASKMLAERAWLHTHSADTMSEGFKVARFGNILGSRGSVLHTFRKHALRNEAIPITHKNMSRFWMTQRQMAEFALRIVTSDFGRGDYRSSGVFLPKLSSSLVSTLVDAIAPNAKTTRIGLRPGEKLTEALVGPEEMPYMKDNVEDAFFYIDYDSVPDESTFDQSRAGIYSDGEARLDVSELCEMIAALEEGDRGN